MGCVIVRESKVVAWGCARSLWVYTESAATRLDDAAAALTSSSTTSASAASGDVAQARRDKRARKQAKRQRRNLERGSSAADDAAGRVDVRAVRCGAAGSAVHPDAQIDVHAEQDAISDAARRGCSLGGATAYITSAPCRVCFALLLNAGVVRIVCGDTLERYTSAEHAERMRSLARFYGVALDEEAVVPPHASLTPASRELRRCGVP
tara:strand:+ start:186 stop:809 length:624 start_codon:yes stop_codon:yes gene_type:complete